MDKETKRAMTVLLAKQDQLLAQCRALIERSDDSAVPALVGEIAERMNAEPTDLAGRWDIIIGQFAAIGLMQVFVGLGLEDAR